MENNHMNLEFIQKLADLVADKNLARLPFKTVTAPLQ